jgi:hypothetical protein
MHTPRLLVHDTVHTSIYPSQRTLGRVREVCCKPPLHHTTVILDFNTQVPQQDSHTYRAWLYTTTLTTATYVWRKGGCGSRVGDVVIEVCSMLEDVVGR